MPLPTTAGASVKISGKDLRDFGIELTDYPSILMPGVRRREFNLPARSGTIDFGAPYTPWEFTISGQIRGTTHQDFVTKKTNFLAFIDTLQRTQQEFLTHQGAIEALTFELSGHFYEYTTGTVSVTNAKSEVTGSGTSWEHTLQPPGRFVVQGDTTVYNIVSVASDTKMGVYPAIARATGSGLTYRAERPRFLFVNYAGSSSISNLSQTHAQFVDTVFPFTMSFRAVYPHWVGFPFWQEAYLPGTSTNEFFTLTGLGKAPFKPIYHIVGDSNTSVNPKITVVKENFSCIFDSYDGSYQPKARTTSSTDADVAPNSFAVNPETLAVAGLLGQGLAIHGNTGGTHGDVLTIAYSTSRIDLTIGTCVFWIRPFNNYNDGKDHMLWECSVSSSNELKLQKTAANNLVFTHAAGGTTRTATIAITEELISAGQWTMTVCRWDTSGTIPGGSNKVQLDLYYINDSDVATQFATPGGDTGSLGTFSGTPSFIRIGHSGSDGAESVDACCDEFAIWETDLSEANIDALWNSGAGAKADTVSPTTLISYVDFDGSGNGFSWTNTNAVEDVKNSTFSDTGFTAMGSQYLWEEGRNGLAMLHHPEIKGTWDNTAYNPRDRGGFIIRGKMLFPSDYTTTASLMLGELAFSSAERFRYTYVGTGNATENGSIRIDAETNGASGNQAATATVSWAYGEYVDIAMTTKAGGATGAFNLYLNGERIGTASTNWDEMDDMPQTIHFGLSNSNRLNAPMLIEQMAFFASIPTDEEIKRIYTDQVPLNMHSRTISYTGTLGTGDVLTLNMLTGEHKVTDVSAGTNASANSSVSGQNPFLEGDDNEEAILYFPVGLQKVGVVGRPHWR